MFRENPSVRVLGSEPKVAEWRAADIRDIASRLPSPASGEPFVIAIDGRSGAGKSSFAIALAKELDATLLSTDDFAWWHSRFGWVDLLVSTALTPLREGQSIDVRPPAWIERGREGSITAPARPVIIVEGVGAGQVAMRPHVNAIVWVQSDADEAERRGIQRDLADRPDPAEAKRFWDEWQQAEAPFQEEQATWRVADLFICGTPELLERQESDPWRFAPGPGFARPASRPRST